MKSKKSQTILFITVFVMLLCWIVLRHAYRKKPILLEVPYNAGCSLLESFDNWLVAVYQDGRVVVWDWDTIQLQQRDFSMGSDRAVLLDSKELAVINKNGKKRLSVYSLQEGSKEKDITVGYQDQEVLIRISPDKNLVALIRQNPPDSKGRLLYEILTVDIENEILSSPVTISAQNKLGEFVDYAVANSSMFFAVGSNSDLGRIVAIDLDKGEIVWDKIYDDTNEFCNVMVSPGEAVIYAGNRKGSLKKIDAETGRIIKEIQLLEEGETRPATNDYSVLNLSFSPFGKYYVASINPLAYILTADSDGMVYKFAPANQLVSKMTFSPDNKFVATSDIRAGYPIKIFPLRKEQNVDK